MEKAGVNTSVKLESEGFTTGSYDCWKIDRMIVEVEKGKNKVSFEAGHVLLLENINIYPFY